MSEVLKAEWENFDLVNAVWTKPSHHTKQKKVEHVLLNPPTVELLQSMKPNGASGPLFPGLKGSHRVTLRRPWVQACKAAGLVMAVSIPGKRRTLTRFKPVVRLHDLRHSFGSHLASKGVPLQVIGKLLGHTQASTTERYAHLSDKAVKDATDVFGKVVQEVVSGIHNESA